MQYLPSEDNSSLHEWSNMVVSSCCVCRLLFCQLLTREKQYEKLLIYRRLYIVLFGGLFLATAILIIQLYAASLVRRLMNCLCVYSRVWRSGLFLSG